MQINVPFALLLTTLAGLSTGIGSGIAYFIRTPKYSYLAVMLGFSAGVMVYISFVELLKTAVEQVGFATANLGFFVGIAFIAVVDTLVPHEYEEERRDRVQSSVASREHLGQGRGTIPPASSTGGRSSVLMRAGVLTALGIAIHNFPEGLVTFSSAATGDVALGLAVAVAIAIHNIPEGMAVSVPIYYATGSRRRAFLYSFSSGLAEPLGALIGYAVLLPFLTPTVLSTLLAFVAGVMVYISLVELLPLAHRYGKEHLVVIGMGAGMLVMAASLFLLN
ncbi:MAG: zinc transporter ZupT [Chloroflexota bacterium]|nr:zinc transporter ZupT [Chloroflexota bacterium]